MSNVLLDIQTGLEVTLKNAVLNVDIAFEQSGYNPVLDTPWIRPTLLPARATTETLAGAEYHKGIFQIDLFFPANKGQGRMLRVMDKIYDAFRNQTITSGTHTIRIDAVGRASKAYDAQESAWCRGVLEVEFACFDY